MFLNIFNTTVIFLGELKFQNVNRVNHNEKAIMNLINAKLWPTFVLEMKA